MGQAGRLRAWLKARPAVGAGIEIGPIGLFDRGRVVTEWVSRTAAPAVEESLLEAVWRERLGAARQSGGALYSGPLCRLERAEKQGGTLRLVLSPTDYREFLGTNVALGDRRQGDPTIDPDRLANPLGVSVALETADGWLLAFRRSRRVTEHPRLLHVVGGNLEPVDRLEDGRIDPFLAAEREVAEEVGVSRDEIEGLTCLGLARARQSYKPELAFSGRLRIDAPEVTVRFARRPGPEHDELILIPAGRDPVIEFLEKRAAEIVPAARACLALWALARG